MDDSWMETHESWIKIHDAEDNRRCKLMRRSIWFWDRIIWSEMNAQRQLIRLQLRSNRKGDTLIKL